MFEGTGNFVATLPTLKPTSNAAKMFEGTGNFAATLPCGRRAMRRKCSKEPVTSRPPPYLEAGEQGGENVHLQRFDAGRLGRLEAVVEVEQHLEAMLLGGPGEHLPEDEDALVDEGDAEGEGQAGGVRLGAVQPAVVVLQGAATCRTVLLQLFLNELVQLVLGTETIK